MSTPLKPPPPYCSERPFHSTGRFTWNLIGGALGSDGAIWPRTLQNSGLAGLTRADGVGPLSATASGAGATIEAESIRTALSAGRIRSLHVVAGSPVIFAAVASAASNEVTVTSEATQAHARALILSPCIVPSRQCCAPRIWLAVPLQWLGWRGRQLKSIRAPPAVPQRLCQRANLSCDLARALRDQARRALVAGVNPQPAQRDAEPVAQADQEVDVGEAPDPPGQIAAHLHPAEIDHGFFLADLRKAASMLVAERRQRAAAQARPDQRRHVTSLLLGGRRDAGHGIAVGAGDRHGVANGKDVGMAGHGQIGLDLQAVGVVGGCVQP